MTTPRKDFELVTPTKAAFQLGVARNTVMHRIATKRYTSEKVGGVTFVVVDDAFTADCNAAAIKSAA
jgi:hypothetical protein